MRALLAREIEAGREPETIPVADVEARHQAIADMMQYSIAELIGRRTWDFVVPAQQDDSRRNITRIGSTGLSDFDLHRQAVRGDGRTIDLLVHTTLIENHPQDGPILLARASGLGQKECEYVRALRPTRIVALGGTAAIPESTLDAAVKCTA